MIIDLFDLNINGKKINIDGEVNIPLELLNDSSIRRLDNVYFQGYINKLIDDSYELCGTLSGDMILPDDITLEDYKYNFTSEIEEKIDETRINLQKSIDITAFPDKICYNNCTGIMSKVRKRCAVLEDAGMYRMNRQMRIKDFVFPYGQLDKNN